MANEIFPYIIPLRQLVYGVRFMLSVHYEPELQCCLITEERLRHPPTHFIHNVDRIKPAAETTAASAAEQCALDWPLKNSRSCFLEANQRSAISFKTSPCARSNLCLIGQFHTFSHRKHTLLSYFCTRF